MRLRINGRDVTIPDGKSVSIINDVVLVDGKEVGQHAKEDGTVLRIEIHGDLPGGLTCDKAVTIIGHVKGNIEAKGSVTCGSVEGHVDAGGSVKCGHVAAGVKANGSVMCGDVQGNVTAGGSITAGAIHGRARTK